MTRALWQSATECPVVFPEGVGVCLDGAGRRGHRHGYQRADGNNTRPLFGHSTACLPPALILISLSASPTRLKRVPKIYVKVLSMGGGLIRQTITDDDLRAIAHDFGVTLNENFLD